MAKELFQIASLAIYDEMRAKEAESLFWRNLFSTEIVSPVTKVDIDVMRDNRSIAVDVLRGSGHHHRNLANSWTGKEYNVPLYSESSPIKAEMLSKRIPGQDPYSPNADVENLAYWAGKLQAQNAGKIMRAENLMAAQACQTGIVTLKNTESIDFKKKSALNLVPTNKWDTVDGNPISDLDTICTRLFTNGKMRPSTVVMDPLAWDLFRNNAKVKAYIGDSQWINPGQLQQTEIRNGAHFHGALSIGQQVLQFYVDDSFYEDENGNAVQYMSDYTVVVMNPKARLVRAYGATEVLTMAADHYQSMGMPAVPSVQPGAYIPWMREEWPSTLEAGVQSAPIVVPVAIDTIGTITSLET